MILMWKTELLFSFFFTHSKLLPYEIWSEQTSTKKTQTVLHNPAWTENQGEALYANTFPWTPRGSPYTGQW